MTGYRLIVQLIYIIVFAGCYLYLVWELPQKHSRLLSTALLLAGLFILYQPGNSSLLWTILRYLRFILLYSAWSLFFLQCYRSYAVYLSVFYTLFMGVCFSFVQAIFLLLNISSNILLTLSSGICRIAAIILLKRFFIQVDGNRQPTLHETILGLFPAAACFMANLVMFDYLIMTDRSMRGESRTLPYLLVLFFAAAAMLVLVSSEHYFVLNRYREENERARQQLQSQYTLFLKEKESREQIQALYHDMKNHLLTIERLGSTPQTQSYVQELQKSLNQMEPLYDTGSSTLDALLMNKKVECDNRNIRLTCYVHLPQLQFLSSMEICTLFGNCLDNAIEAVSDLPLENREIRISGGEVNQNIVITVSNPFAHPLQQQENRFATTKKDKAHHGYGLLNVRHVVESHDGTLTFQTENACFRVCWMIPIPKSKRY